MSSTITPPRSKPRRYPLPRRARQAGMSFNQWYPAAFSRDVPKGEAYETTFWGESIALYRGADGVVSALENRCPHRGIKLSHGTVENCELVCLYHGWTFDRGGALVGMKHDDFGRKLPVVSVRSYPAKERYGIVWIFPGDAKLAKVTPLVEIPFVDSQNITPTITNAYTWRAHHSMVIDNLCNLTHLWVHGNWVPYGDTQLADSSADLDRLTLLWEHDLRRDIMHPVTAPFFRKAKGRNDSDTFMIYDYPYQSATSNQRVRSTNFMLPIDETHTKVFSVQFWKEVPIPFVGSQKIPRALMQRVVMPVLRPITMEIFRQDGFTVEEEQLAWAAAPERPIPEPNPMVRAFNEVTVRKWDEYVAYRETGEMSEEQLAEQTRQKVL